MDMQREFSRRTNPNGIEFEVFSDNGGYDGIQSVTADECAEVNWDYYECAKLALVKAGWYPHLIETREIDVDYENDQVTIR